MIKEINKSKKMDYDTLNSWNIFKKVSPLEIMQHYFPEYVEFNKKYANPFRVDNKKGCYFSYSQKGNLIFFDNAQPEYGGDCFKVVRMATGVTTFKESLSRVNRDMNLGLREGYSGITPTREDYLTKLRTGMKATKGVRSIKELTNDEKEVISKLNSMKKTKFHYKINTRAWSQEDYNYWTKRFGLSLKLLNSYNVYPINTYGRRRWDEGGFKQQYEYNDNDIYKKEEKFVTDIAYCFVFKDAINLKAKRKQKPATKVKIYRPYAEDFKFKWSTNTGLRNIQGYEQLPENEVIIKEYETTGNLPIVEKEYIKHKLLIITSSMKDLLVLVEAGFHAIAPQGEGSLIPEDIIEDLKNRYEKIVIMYDKDLAGIRYANKHSEKYNLPFSILPNFIGKSHLKDFADYKEDFINQYSYMEFKARLSLANEQIKIMVKSMVNKAAMTA